MRKCKNCGEQISQKNNIGKSGIYYLHVWKGSLGTWFWTKDNEKHTCNNPEVQNEAVWEGFDFGWVY